MTTQNPAILDLISALELGNERTTDDAFSKILLAIEQDDGEFGEAEVEYVNTALRDYRQNDYIVRYAELLSAEGRNTFRTDKHYAQAQIDRGCPKSALPLLRAMIRESEGRMSFVEFSEASGLVGRAHKDLFLLAAESDRNGAEKHLKQAFQAYGEPWDRKPELCVWHGVNLLALNSNAAVGGFSIPVGFNAERIADSVIEIVSRIDRTNRSYWDWASLSEAYVAKRNWVSASAAIVDALDTAMATPFQLNGTLRQFKEVWRLQSGGTGGANIVTWLERNIIGQPNSEIRLDADDIDRQLATDDSQLESLHSHHRMRSGQWIRKYLLRGESVASIVDISSGEPMGTCSIIDGSVFSDRLRGKLLCLTNDHVMSNFPEPYSSGRQPLSPENAAVRFTQSDSREKKYPISKILWSSPFTVHDACLFEVIGPLPVTESTIPIVSHVPSVNARKPEEIFIISHPERDALSFSFQNTNLVDHDAKTRGKESVVPGLIHYTTPTVPGSSGGIALNAELEMVGLHHAGGSEIDRLNGIEGTYAVNEAIWIQPIVNAIRSSMEQGIDRWV